MNEAGRKLSWDELARENEELKQKLELARRIANGEAVGTQLSDPLFEAVRGARHNASLAILAANQRNIRAARFMEAERLARTIVEVSAEVRGPGAARSWKELSTYERNELLLIAKKIRERFAEVAGGKGESEDPKVMAILSDGHALTRALEEVRALRNNGAYAKLEELNRYLRSHFPGQKIEGEVSTLDATRRAIELLDMLTSVAPILLQHMWNDIIQPTLRKLSEVGIEILPPGTIVYGAKPNTNVHRPE